MPMTSITRRNLSLAIGATAVLLSAKKNTMAQTLTEQTQRLPEKVSFKSGDGFVVANLYLPEGHDPSRRYPAVALAGSLTSVKEMMAGNYAGELTRRGIIALAIDYRNYGESSGAMRQFEDQASKAEDLSAALRYLKKRSDVAGTGILGICTSGGTALYTAAKDSNVGALAIVAGFFSDPDLVLKMFGGKEGIDSRIAASREARKRYDEEGVIQTVFAYMPNDKTAVSSGPNEYYMDQSRGGSVRAWRNEFAVMAWEPWLAFDPLAQAPHVTAPALVVHSDGAAFPDQARKMYGLLAGPKELHWTEGKHYDFYDQAEAVRQVADRVASHFHNKLG
ncbi:alpha/beta hydrolase [Mesorhizobium sp. WSM3860]|uniref:alpha/beta hydrolase n=1 Tax=Mesorhizobium sp. WSM3860 TaxID=2029403 RepID=UPI000BB040AB|nr:alpha/beta hydrolase [Mesorhizobium sp. WSM3860]PBC02450.1 twin-arginine translocation pathway signal protein [Mesorhizobium sp. WSM3860]